MPYTYTRDEFEEKVAPIFRYNFANEFLQIASEDYYLGMKKFDELRYVYSSARYLLWQATMPADEYKLMGIESPATILWLRVTYWQSSIIWLNNAEDYILKAFWLALNLNNVSKINKAWYTNEMNKTFYYSMVYSKMKKKGSRELVTLMEMYRDDMRYIRKLANKLKHGRMVEIEELNQVLNNKPMVGVYVMKPGTKSTHGEMDPNNVLYSDKDLSERSYSFAEVIEKTISATHVLYKYADEVRNNILSEDKFFAHNENGSITGVNRDFKY